MLCQRLYKLVDTLCILVPMVLVLAGASLLVFYTSECGPIGIIIITLSILNVVVSLSYNLLFKLKGELKEL